MTHTLYAQLSTPGCTYVERRGTAQEIVSRAITTANHARVFVTVGTLEEPKQEEYEPAGSDPKECECN